MKYLKIAGVLTAVASLTHLLIIIGGASFYRFFGAGEKMAVMSEQGSSYPTVVTFFISSILARGLLAIPVVIFADSPYMSELAGNMTLMVVSSVICLIIGVCYGLGTYQLIKQQDSV